MTRTQTKTSSDSRFISDSIKPRLIRWGWIDASGNPISFAENVKLPKKQHFVLEEVEDVEDADFVQTGGKLYPLKESDVKKLKAAERRSRR